MKVGPLNVNVNESPGLHGQSVSVCTLDHNERDALARVGSAPDAEAGMRVPSMASAVGCSCHNWMAHTVSFFAMCRQQRRAGKQ